MKPLTHLAPLLRKHFLTPRAIRLPSRTMSTPAHHPPADTPADQQPTSANQQSTSTQQQTPLPLPSPSDASTPLNVNGDGVKLDHLGPLVVNKDGSLSRIANWETMAEIERQNTLRILGKRNQLRLGGLRDAEGKKEEGGK